jgi:hypothetical protein
VSIFLDKLKEKDNWQSICLSTLLTNMGVAIVLVAFSDVTEIRISQSLKGIFWRTVKIFKSSKFFRLSLKKTEPTKEPTKQLVSE